MSHRFKAQYNILGLEAPAEGSMTPAEKSEIIFHAACKVRGLDPAAGPIVHHLPEEFQVFPVSAFRLQIIREAITAGRIADWNNRNELKWGSWWYMNKPGFRLLVVRYDRATSASTGGPRLCTFSEEDETFFATECIALWADFCGGTLPA